MSINQTPLSKLQQQWQPWLAWFDEKLQPIFASLLSQLDIFLGPIKTEQAFSRNELVGLSAIRQRGRYEHLLLSEWLLAKEAPDEFIRRAAANEHLFLAPEPEIEKNSKVIIALFDAGVLQLGRTRIVHLVMMLLLDKRAKKTQSQFYWGTIQQPGKLYPFIGLDSLQALLLQKSALSVGIKNIEHWQVYIQNNIQFDECWFVGAPISKDLLNKYTLFSHYITGVPAVSEPHQLNITITQDQKQRSCQLTLPNETMCIKILSGQLAHNHSYVELVKKSLVSIDPYFYPIISTTGNQVVTLNNEHSHTFLCLLADILSNKQKCRLNFYHFIGKLQAFDFQGKKLSCLLTDKEDVYFLPLNKTRIKLSALAESLLFDDSRQQLFMWLYTNHSTCVYLVDKYQTLFCYRVGDFVQNEVCIGTQVDNDVLGLFKLDHQHNIYVKLNAGELWLKSPQLPHLNYYLGKTGQHNQQMYLANESAWLRGFGVYLIGSQQNWLLFEANNTENTDVAYRKSLIKTPVGWSVFGVYYLKDEAKIQLVMTHQDGKRIALFDVASQTTEEMYYTQTRIVQYSFSSLANACALTTEQGEMILYSFLSNSARVRTTKEVASI